MVVEEEQTDRRELHRARREARRSPGALPALVALALVLATAAAIIVASLALAHVAVGWGVFFFYTLPALLFLGWSVRELAPSLWRRTVFPFVWLWSCTTGRTPGLVGRDGARSASTPMGEAQEIGEVERSNERHEEEVVRRHGNGVLSSSRVARFEERTIQPWLLVMRASLSAWRSPHARRLLNTAFGLAALALTGLASIHFAQAGWPLAHADVRLVVAAGALLISTFAFKAFAWQRLFRRHERPASLSLVAATGVAALAGVALPGRFDDALRVTVVRSLARVRVGIGTIALSLFLLGLLDTAAMAPFAADAAITSHASGAVRVALAVVAGAGIGAGFLAAALPRISASGRLGRYRIARWLAKHAPASSREAMVAALLVFGSWLARMAGLLVLLSAFGFQLSFPLAAGYMAAGAASAALPISPGGAATQAGVGAAVLTASGVPAEQSIAFSVVAQLLTILAGTLILVFALGLRGCRRLQAGGLLARSS